MTRKASWREYAIAIVLFIAGVVYLAMQVIALIRGDSSPVSTDSDSIHINKYEALNQLRTAITILSCIAGAILLFKQRKVGWMLSLAMLLLFTTIATAGLSSLFQMRIFDIAFYLAATGSVILFSLLLMLFSLAKKFELKKNDWIRVILLCTLLGVIFFSLQ